MSSVSYKLMAVVLVLLVCVWMGAEADDTGGELVAVVTGPEFVNQGGGEARYQLSRYYPTFSHWDNPGHWLEWEIVIPKDGYYLPVFMYATGMQEVTRNLSIDGDIVAETLRFETTTSRRNWGSVKDDWKWVVFGDCVVHLKAGIRKLRMENTVPPGTSGGLNLAWIALVSPPDPSLAADLIDDIDRVARERAAAFVERQKQPAAAKPQATEPEIAFGSQTKELVERGVEGIPELQKILETRIFEAYRRERLEAVLALNQIGGPEIIPALKTALIQEPEIRAAALEGLIANSGIPSWRLIVELLEDDRDYRGVALDILRSTAREGTSVETVSLILDYFADRRDSDTVNKAINLISTFYLESDQAARAKIFPVFVAKLEIDNAAAVVTARVLRELRGEAAGAVSELVSVLRSPETSRELRVAASEALEMIAPASDEVIEAYIDLLSHYDLDEKLHWPAVRALETAGAPVGDRIFAVFDLLEKLNEPMRWRLAGLFVRACRENPELTARFSSLLEGTSDEGLLYYAVRILGAVQGLPRETVDILLKMTNEDYSDGLKRAIARSLEPAAAEDDRVLAIQKQFPAVETQPLDPLPAFPGAEGRGAFATGGRGGEVYIVTNLNDSGPGSLRDAVSKSNRIVVFAVSGNIDLKSELRIPSNITIAGQTAPGDGITVRDYPVAVYGSNVIIRHMRFRLGDRNNLIRSDAFNIMPGASNVIVDHCSISWGVDEVLSTYDNQNITVQWCLIGEGLNLVNHSCSGLWGPRASYHHNLIYSSKTRNPKFAYLGGGIDDVVDFRNNVIYNWWEMSTYTDSQGRINMVGNYFKPGPSTDSGVRDILIDPDSTVRLYLEDNYLVGNSEVTADNWLGVKSACHRVDEPFPAPAVTTVSPKEAFELVIKGAGATVPARDSVDRRAIEDLLNGTGRIIHRQGEVGGWPELFAVQAPVDSDADGMPDMWEIYYGLDPFDPADCNEDRDGDGYTNIEEYINALTEEHVLWP